MRISANKLNMKKVLIIIGVIILIFGALVIYVFLDFNSAYQPSFFIKELKTNSLEERIYIKKMNWGVSADHEILVLSTSAVKEFAIVILMVSYGMDRTPQEEPLREIS